MRIERSLVVFGLLLVGHGCGPSHGAGGYLASSAASLSSNTASVGSSTPSADYEKQHSLLLVCEGPPPGQTGSYSISTVHPDGTGKTLLGDGDTPNWTPDGRVIFVSERGGTSQIWMMDADGGNAAQVGSLSATMLPLMPQLGRNGLIAFMGADASGTGGTSNPGIWIMQKDGSGLEELTTGQQPSLALSGTWVAYTYQTENPYHREIWRMNTDGTGQQQLTFLGDPDYPDANAPNISPDESMVAFFSGKESDEGAAGFTQSIFTFGHRNVAVIPATGGARRTLTPAAPVTTQAELDAATTTPIACDNPAWTPDGEWIICDVGFGPSATAPFATGMVDLSGRNFQEFYSGGRGTVRVALKTD